jgi:hypothetical protein
MINFLIKYVTIFFLCFAFNSISIAQQSVSLNAQQIRALAYLDSVGKIDSSVYWPHIKPKRFIQNIRKNITSPTFIYAGSNTNFCSYAALSYSCISTYSLRYARFMIELYKNGKADFRKVHFNPSNKVKLASGQLRFKGELDINHADQMFYMSLADHFKGYINWLSLSYGPGKENVLWPSTNFAKFNRMLRRICDYKVDAVGSDLIRPIFSDVIAFLNQKLVENHQVFLFINNAILHKSNHNKVKFRFPTHYVVLFSITESAGITNLIYWDYGCKTLLQLPTETFKDILFGVTWCNKNAAE